ncbi:Hypothetical predicted protein [Paramuricea clavata]|uniref:Uncharacterized protein n=1 Tax=Paramuricea clavata TaxID=317549 RepID=A0A6S7KFT0_PARCT|nr:Hypothetical predicted protein [Paramuricea clavata]
MNINICHFRNLPQWSAFHIDSFDPQIQPVEALEQLDCLVQGISAVWTINDTRYQHRFKVDYDKLSLSEVFKEILMPKLEANLTVLGSQTKDAKDKVHVVLSSVIITYVFTKYHVNLKCEQYETLLKCLKLPPDKEVCSEFMKSINEFDDNILRQVYGVVISGISRVFEILNKEYCYHISSHDNARHD